MKKLLLLFIICLTTQLANAQTPKWLDKAKKAVFSIVTYDKDNNILKTGNGFFVTEDGVALSDYSLFKDAYKGVIINADGKQMTVESILGANDMYDVIKFKVAITDKKVTALNIASNALAVGSEAYLLPYTTQKDKTIAIGTVKDVSKINDKYNYYTLNIQMKDKMVSCPILNSNGQVFGIAQKATGKDSLSICYAASAGFAMSLSTSGLSINDLTLSSIHIKKALPNSEEQALIYLFVASSQLPIDDYMTLLNDFISTYPNNPEGYTRRAAAAIFKDNNQEGFNKAAEDYDRALKMAPKKEEVYYSLAKQIYNYQLEKPETVYNDWTFDKAIETINKAIAINPLPLYQQTAGDIYFANKDFENAAKWYDKVNSTNLASSASFFSLAKTKEILGAEASEVIAIMDSCIAHAGSPITVVNAPYLLERAQMLMNNKQYRQAVKDYDSYYEAVSGQVNDVFYYYREQAALQGKQYQRALNDINDAIKLNPNEQMYQIELAVINIRVARFQEAAEVLNSIIAKDPTYGEAYRLLGICQVQLKENAAACKNFAKAKELGDTHVDELIQKHCK